MEFLQMFQVYHRVAGLLLDTEQRVGGGDQDLEYLKNYVFSLCLQVEVLCYVEIVNNFVPFISDIIATMAMVLGM